MVLHLVRLASPELRERQDVNWQWARASKHTTATLGVAMEFGYMYSRELQQSIVSLRQMHLGLSTSNE